MTKKLIKIFAFIAILVFFSSFIVYKIGLPAAQDIPREMKNGEDILYGKFDVINKNVYSYTEPDQPFANHHWLSGVFFYILHKAVNWNGMVIFKIILLLSTFSLLFYTALKKADFWLVAILSLPTIFILIGRTALRPEIFSYFFVAVFLYLLFDLQEHPERKRIFWLIPLQILWVNMHLFFGVGILITAGFLFEKIIWNYKNLKNNLLVKKLAIILVILVAVSFLSPYGIKGAIFSVQVNTITDFPISSAETRPISAVLKSAPYWENISVGVFPILLLILAMSFIVDLVFRWRKKQLLSPNNLIFYFLAIVSTAALGFFVVRTLSLFGLMFLPAVSANFNGAFVEAKNRFKFLTERKKILLSVFSVTFMLFYFIIIFWGQIKILQGSELGIGLAPRSEDSAKFFKEQGLKGPIFNDTDIGSYLIYYLYPEEKVFVDNRFGDAYSASFFRDILLPMTGDENIWKEMAKKYGFNVIFLYQYDRGVNARDFLFRRMHDPEWALVYADTYAAIFLKNNQENQEVIKKFQITRENAPEKLKFLLDSDGQEDQIAAADILMLIGQEDLAFDTYMKVVSSWPHKGKVWMIMGEIKLSSANLEKQNPYLAALFLERAILEGFRTTESYSYLALAYFRTGQLDRAREAVMKELKIDPESIDGHRWLGVLAEEEAKKVK